MASVLEPDFPPATREQWLALVDKALKGKGFETLVSQTRDGIAIQPLYIAGDGPRALRATPGRWAIVQRVDHPNLKEANRLALADLEGGADALALVLAGAPSARGFGLRIESTDDLDAVLADVRLDYIHLRLETAPFDGRRMTMLVSEVVTKRGLNPAQVSLDFGLDPVGDMARTGGAPLQWPELAARAGETANGLNEQGFARGLMRVDARGVHEAGGTEAQELAFALATGVAYLRLMEAAGFSLDAARRALTFLMAADADEFLTIAKFRALRRLWAEVETACGLDPAPIRLEAETAWRITSRRDPWVNLLRGTMAAFSAGIGGADAIGVTPLSAALGLPDGFARRMARNTSLILMDEANLWRVEDPAAGAGGFEALTEELTGKACSLFQHIEAAGGIAQALQSGQFQRDVAQAQAKRASAIATRRIALTGTSEFPNIHEKDVEVLRPAPLAAPSPETPFAPLASIRDAADFEQLRDLADTRLKETGARPRIFVATLGTAADFTARATFTRNFFEAGGIEAMIHEGEDSDSALVAAFKASGTKLACIASSDALYEERLVAAAVALGSAGAGVYVAGQAGNLAEQLRHSGVIGHIHAGCDAIAVLNEALSRA